MLLFITIQITVVLMKKIKRKNNKKDIINPIAFIDKIDIIKNK